MIYGNKITVLILLSFFLLFGCQKVNNWSYQLYDGYQIKQIDNNIKLYQNDEEIKINDLNYQIKALKYNSDVVCLQLTDNTYYMIYYVDTSIYGPYTKENLDETVKSLAMTFKNDFLNIQELEGKKDERTS